MSASSKMRDHFNRKIRLGAAALFVNSAIPVILLNLGVGFPLWFACAMHASLFGFFAIVFMMDVIMNERSLSKVTRKLNLKNPKERQIHLMVRQLAKRCKISPPSIRIRKPLKKGS